MGRHLSLTKNTTTFGPEAYRRIARIAAARFSKGSALLA